jgi:hypothetical protein
MRATGPSVTTCFEEVAIIAKTAYRERLAPDQRPEPDPNDIRICRLLWVSRWPGLWFAGTHDEEVRGDPGVSNLRVGCGGFLVGAGFGDRVDDQAGGEDGTEPSS